MTSKNGQSQTEAEQAALRARADALAKQLEARRPAATPAEGASKQVGDSAALSQGMRAASELVSGVVVGAAIGWTLDFWLGTKPWLFVVFFVLGVGAGFWNVTKGAFSPTVAGQNTVRDEKSPHSGA